MSDEAPRPRAPRLPIPQRHKDSPRKRKAESWLLRLLAPAVRLAAAVAGRLGADRGACEAILHARVLLDVRTGGLKSPNKQAGGMLLTVASYGLMGLFVGALVLFAPIDGMVAMAAVQAVLLLLVGMLLAGDYLSMLIDPAESDVVAPCPVSGRTLLLARVGHLVLYLTPPLTSFLLPTWLAGFGRDDRLGWLLLLGPISALTVSFTVCVLLIGFVVLLQRLDSERLRGVLLRLQIASSFVVFGGYYLGAGLLSREDVRAWLLAEHLGLLVLPPYWFGGLYELLGGRLDGLRLSLGCLGLAGVIAALAVLLRSAGPRLVTGLASLRGAGDGASVTTRRGAVRRLAARVVQPGVERAGFDAFLAFSARERGFRSRVYPLLVVPFVMLAWFAFSPRSEGDGQLFVWATVIPALYSLLILVQVRFSDTPDACWIFSATPLERPGLFVSGVVKALVLAYLLPWIVLVMLAGALLSAGLPLRDIAFGTALSVSMTLAFAQRITGRHFPFSREFSPRQSQQTPLMMLGMLAVGVLAGIHHGLSLLPWALELGVLLLLPLIAWQLRRLRGLRLEHDALRVR